MAGADWLARDHGRLRAIPEEFAGNPAYNAGNQRQDLARLTFPLGLLGSGGDRDGNREPACLYGLPGRVRRDVDRNDLALPEGRRADRHSRAQPAEYVRIEHVDRRAVRADRQPCRGKRDQSRRTGGTCRARLDGARLGRLTKSVRMFRRCSSRRRSLLARHAARPGHLGVNE